MSTKHIKVIMNSVINIKSTRWIIYFAMSLLQMVCFARFAGRAERKQTRTESEQRKGRKMNFAEEIRKLLKKATPEQAEKIYWFIKAYLEGCAERR